MGPVLLSAPKPDYPSAARAANIEGTALVSLVIDTDGSVAEAHLAGSSGNSQLDQAAVHAVYQWSFAPAKQNGTPVQARATVPVTFRLR